MGEKIIKKSSSALYRYDLRVPAEVEPLMRELGLSYRELLVYLIFSRGVEFYDALDETRERVQIDRIVDWDRDPVGDPYDWQEVDRFALDCSKTFVNGSRYL